jgi:hypothetical protein
MTPELEQIRDEIMDLRVSKADIQFLEALANNAIFCLSKYQKEQIPTRTKQAIDIVITDVLNTLTKEIEWVKEEVENENFPEIKSLFGKAKKQILSDINQLF